MRKCDMLPSTGFHNSTEFQSLFNDFMIIAAPWKFLQNNKGFVQFPRMFCGYNMTKMLHGNHGMDPKKSTTH